VTIKNLNFIRAIPGIGARLYEALQSIQQQATATEQQTNANGSSQPQAPPAINGVHVSTGPGGEFQVAITDNNQISRGVKYFAEHDTSPNFTNPHVIDMGTSRNHSTYLGSQALYWRAYSSYQSSPPSAPAYHGGAAQPLAVTGGVIGTRAPSMGSGTGAPRQGLSGPGPVAQRNSKSGFNWTAQSLSKVP
jgi:hypothetical protein